MPDSQDQPRPRGTEAVFRSSSQSPSGNQQRLDSLLEMSKGLIDLELAATEPAGERMSLRERTVRLRLEVFKYVLAALLTLTVVGLQIAAFVVSPLLFSFNLLVAALAAWRHFGKKAPASADDEGEGDP